MGARMVVKGFGAADGTYDADLKTLTEIGTADAFDSREQHLIQRISDVRGAEIQEEAFRLNAALMVAIAHIILARNDKAVNVEKIWNARILYNVTGDELDLSEIKTAIVFEAPLPELAEDGDDADDPPAETPLLSETPSLSGGGSSSSTLVDQGNVQSLTGRLDSRKSVTSGQETSAV